MKNVKRLVSVLLVGAILGGMIALPRASAQDDRDRDLGARLERLERHVRLLTERQEHLNAAMQQQRGPAPQPPGPGMRPPEPQPPGARQLQPQWGPQGPRPGTRPAVAVNWPGDHAKRAFWKLVGLGRLVMLILVIVHISLAIWVYGDIKKRGEGHGIFIILALLAGIPAGILYALIRIGDRKTASS